MNRTKNMLLRNEPICKRRIPAKSQQICMIRSINRNQNEPKSNP